MKRGKASHFSSGQQNICQSDQGRGFLPSLGYRCYHGKMFARHKIRGSPDNALIHSSMARIFKCLSPSLVFASACVSAHSASACALALVLAMDGSASVDAREHQLQLNGLAIALSDPEVVNAIEVVGGIYVTSFEWSGRFKQIQQLDWQFLSDAASAQRAADTLRAALRGYTEFPTALGYALGHAAVLMEKAPVACRRKVIDIAGDGINNEGFGPSSAYKAFNFDGITVNGLVIAGADTEPLEYYRANVIRGLGAFIEVAASYDDYADAMKRKLIREIFGSGYASLE